MAEALFSPSKRRGTRSMHVRQRTTATLNPPNSRWFPPPQQSNRTCSTWLTRPQFEPGCDISRSRFRPDDVVPFASTADPLWFSGPRPTVRYDPVRTCLKTSPGFVTSVTGSYRSSVRLTRVVPMFDEISLWLTVFRFQILLHISPFRLLRLHPEVLSLVVVLEAPLIRSPDVCPISRSLSSSTPPNVFRTPTGVRQNLWSVHPGRPRFHPSLPTHPPHSGTIFHLDKLTPCFVLDSRSATERRPPGWPRNPPSRHRPFRRVKDGCKPPQGLGARTFHPLSHLRLLTHSTGRV